MTRTLLCTFLLLASCGSFGTKLGTSQLAQLREGMTAAAALRLDGILQDGHDDLQERATG